MPNPICAVYGPGADLRDSHITDIGRTKWDKRAAIAAKIDEKSLRGAILA